MGPRLLWFVLKPDGDRAVIAANLPHPLDEVVPVGEVVGRKQVVVAVLARPDAHDRGFHPDGKIDRPFCPCDGLFAHPGIGRRKGPVLPPRVAKQLHRHRRHDEARLLDEGDDFLLVFIQAAVRNKIDARRSPRWRPPGRRALRPKSHARRPGKSGRSRNRRCRGRPNSPVSTTSSFQEYRTYVPVDEDRSVHYRLSSYGAGRTGNGYLQRYRYGP